MQEKPQNKVYGVDHSPWVQAVLIGLHLRGVDYDLTPLPSLSSLSNTGLRMPAMQVAGEWQTESAALLEAMAFDSASAADRAMIAATWQGVMHRGDNAYEFFRRFAAISMRSDSLFLRSIRQLLRPLVSLFFFTLIRGATWRLKPRDPRKFANQFKPVNERLQDQPFLAGSEPGILDFQQFGIVQCHCSIVHPPLLRAMTDDPELAAFRAWVLRMQDLLQDYEHLYSPAFFGTPERIVKPASPAQQALFWLGLALYLSVLPVTATLLGWLMVKSIKIQRAEIKNS